MSFPRLGQDAGLTYIGGVLTPDFHEEPSITHLYQKPVA